MTRGGLGFAARQQGGLAVEKWLRGLQLVRRAILLLDEHPFPTSAATEGFTDTIQCARARSTEVLAAQPHPQTHALVVSPNYAWNMSAVLPGRCRVVMWPLQVWWCRIRPATGQGRCELRAEETHVNRSRSYTTNTCSFLQHMNTTDTKKAWRCACNYEVAEPRAIASIFSLRFSTNSASTLTT